MNDCERETHLAGNSARDWVGLAAVLVLLVIVAGVVCDGRGWLGV